MAEKRAEPMTSEMLAGVFNAMNGYYDFGNQELAYKLMDWKLTEEKNRADPEIATLFLKWSFTSSYLHLLNSIQWLTAGVLLSRTSDFPAQVIQLYYYSIFFSYGGFLAAHGKGHYSIGYKSKSSKEDGENGEETLSVSEWLDKISNDNSKSIKTIQQEPTKIRREIWFDFQQSKGKLTPCISLRDKNRSNEHKNRAMWFYEVFMKWEYRTDYPDVLEFKDMRSFHSDLRNMFTYSLADIAEELYSVAGDNADFLPNEELLELWHGSPLAEFHPEVYWALWHLKVLVDMHIKLLEGYDEKSTPYSSTQIRLTEGLLKHHEITGMEPIIREILDPIIKKMGL